MVGGGQVAARASPAAEDAGKPASAGAWRGITAAGRGLPQWRDRERARQLAWLGQGPLTPGWTRLKDTVMLGRWPHQEGWGAQPTRPRGGVAQALALADLSHLADRDALAP